MLSERFSGDLSTHADQAWHSHESSEFPIYDFENSHFRFLNQKKHCNENAHIGNRENEDSCRPHRGRAWSARVVGSRQNRSDNIWTPKSKIYIFHNIEIIIFRVSLLGFGENGDRRWGNDGWMMQRKYTPLPIPIKSLCTNFESKPSKTKVVSSVQLQNQGLDLLTNACIFCAA